MHFDLFHWRQAALKIKQHFRFDRSLDYHLFKLTSLMDTKLQWGIVLTSFTPDSWFHGVSLCLLPEHVYSSSLFSRNNKVRGREAVPDTGCTQLALLDMWYWNVALSASEKSFMSVHHQEPALLVALLTLKQRLWAPKTHFKLISYSFSCRERIQLVWPCPKERKYNNDNEAVLPICTAVQLGSTATLLYK